MTPVSEFNILPYFSEYNSCNISVMTPVSDARELLETTCRLGNLLRRRGITKGDCVTIYLPPCPMAVAAMLACARIGATHNVVFAGFSAEALAQRIRDGEGAESRAGGGLSVEWRSSSPPPLSPPAAGSRTVITANQGVRGGRVLELKQTVDAAVSSCPQVKDVLVTMRTETPVQLRDRDLLMEEVCGRGLL